ncbi:MAG TPA: cupredoxin domain-containing protein [Baekduia sp.]|nr:cupredoxin domain-containing protein [Baekduia sp.]
MIAGRTRGRRRALVALALAGTAVAVPASGAGASKHHRARHKTRTVTVNDNWFGPSKLTIHAGDKVRWRWTQDTFDVHDVDLKKGPKRARKFHSDPLAAGDTFTQRLKRPGRYKIVCTFHEDMTMTITVRKALG